MRILVVSNLYPPQFIGGYELGCRDVVEALRERGHQVKVLTSTYGISHYEDDGQVYRWLDSTFTYQEPAEAWPFIKEMFEREIHSNNALTRLCHRFKPDVIYIWNMRKISISMLFRIQNRGIPVCYFVSDQWLANWEEEPWIRFWRQSSHKRSSYLLKRFLRPFLRLPMLPSAEGKLDLQHVQFCSQYLKNHALEYLQPVTEAAVIHWGVDPSRFCPSPRGLVPKRILFVGQLLATKGPHTVIEAMRYVVESVGTEEVRLTVAGGSTEPEYEKDLHDLVETLNLGDYVDFTGLLPRESLPDVYKQHDILVFATIGHEPFSISLLEALSSELAIVSTCTGGTGEILQDGYNALLYPAGDARSCAVQLLRLLHDPVLYQQIRRNGREAIEKGFTFDHMISKIETALDNVVAQKQE